ncbi:hypothetical protein EA772_16165 [Pedobacter sp. G11]|uniref:hypothetical protein n=1 Tax=Pedobacter sp. G11 TaxID=2482728 RepID=UPI000F5DC3C4|nr:hypothetical protein [Pedobacter sp. G11]AZI26795.1 hypothetical protein EA772_16165 [Pedobacter sp. G11]
MENNKSKEEIIQELKEFHEGVANNPAKNYDSNEVDDTISDLDEQISGSDADSDQSLNPTSDEAEKQKQSKGSDAAKA